MTACFDSNVIIDMLRGVAEAQDYAREEQDRHISIMTWIEVMTGAERRGEAAAVRQALRRFNTHDLNAAIAERAVTLRNVHGLRSPDAVIWATALHIGAPLVTRNTKDFPVNDPTILVPYSL